MTLANTVDSLAGANAEATRPTRAAVRPRDRGAPTRSPVHAARQTHATWRRAVARALGQGLLAALLACGLAPLAHAAEDAANRLAPITCQRVLITSRWDYATNRRAPQLMRQDSQNAMIGMRFTSSTQHWYPGLRVARYTTDNFRMSCSSTEPHLIGGNFSLVIKPSAALIDALNGIENGRQTTRQKLDLRIIPGPNVPPIHVIRDGLAPEVPYRVDLNAGTIFQWNGYELYTMPEGHNPQAYAPDVSITLEFIVRDAADARAPDVEPTRQTIDFARLLGAAEAIEMAFVPDSVPAESRLTYPGRFALNTSLVGKATFDYGVCLPADILINGGKGNANVSFGTVALDQMRNYRIASPTRPVRIDVRNPASASRQCKGLKPVIRLIPSSGGSFDPTAGFTAAPVEGVSDGNSVVGIRLADSRTRQIVGDSASSASPKTLDLERFDGTYTRSFTATLFDRGATNMRFGPFDIPVILDVSYP